MAHIGYLTMHSLENFECYDHLTYRALRTRGHSVVALPWREPTDWSQFDAIIIRSTWDYQDDPGLFLQVLASIESSAARLLNPLNVVCWNIDKSYLGDLAESGVAIVPTHFAETLRVADVEEAAIQFDTDQLIVKPAISANADDTFWITPENLDSFAAGSLGLFRDRRCLVQPFLPAVVDEGEYSQFYFNGAFSHCILKTPKVGDFRVQEEHGGRLQLIENPEPALLAAGRVASAAISDELLYARLDFVRHDGRFLLMEAELIEPSLYFNLDDGAIDRFAIALDAQLTDGR
jgi:hypothetical protein